MKKKINQGVRPTLVKVGNNFVNPVNVSAIRAVKVKTRQHEYAMDDGHGNSWDEEFEDLTEPKIKVMYVIDFISNPNPNYTLWAEKKDIKVLLEQFNIIVSD